MQSIVLLCLVYLFGCEHNKPNDSDGIVDEGVDQFTFSGEPGTPAGDDFGGIQLQASLGKQFSENGEQVCLMPDGATAVRFDLTLPRITTYFAANISGTTQAEIGAYDLSDSNYTYDLLVPSPVVEETFGFPMDHVVILAAEPVDTLCIGPVYLWPDADNDGYSQDSDSDDADATTH